MSLTPDEKAELVAIDDEKTRRDARLSLLAFTRYTKPNYEVGWHHASMAGILNRFVEGEIPRLMIMAPPRHGKSELVSRRLPAYLFGRRPEAQVVAASYGSSLASRMNRDVQRIIDSPRYQELFPEVRLYGKNVRSVALGSWLRNNDIFEIVGHGGVYRSAGIGGGITGMGADFAIIDDPIKDQAQANSPTYREAAWAWYNSTLFTRLEKGGSVLLTLTRWHEDDLAGRLLELAKSDPVADQWTVVRYEAVKETDEEEAVDDPRGPGEALWPNKYNEARLKKVKASVGTQVWNAVYSQRPSALQGSMVKRAWFKFYRELPARFDDVLTSWDMSFKDSEGSDYVVGQVWGRAGADKYLIDEVRDRMDFPTAVAAVKLLAAKHPKVYLHLVEDKANGPAVIATLKNKISGMVPVEPEGSKQARLSSVTPDYEAGNVYVPDPSIAPWVHDHITEMVNFPKWPHDDRVDAASQALIRLRTSEEAFPEQPKGKTTTAPSLKSGDQW